MVVLFIIIILALLLVSFIFFAKQSQPVVCVTIRDSFKVLTCFFAHCA